eukprot:6325235-Alexandrium_andersonii.AAC.1
MSASLVGSEMCIRDRRCTPGTPRAATEGVADLRRIRARDRDVSARGPAAVSYTHLTLPTICSV